VRDTSHREMRLASLLYSIATMLASSSTPIICCASASEVQNAVTVFAKPGNVVLELGAELGDVSAHICQVIGASGRAWMVDKKRSEPKSGRMARRNVETFVAGTNAAFIELDDLSHWKAKIPLQPYDVIVMSVSHILGHDLYMTMLSLADEIINSIPNEPRAIIIKSRALYSLSRRLVHSQRLFDGTTVLPSDMPRSSQPYLIAGVKVDEYRKTIPFVVRTDDAILEVGSHFGRTTKLLDDAGRYCIGVDIGPKIIDHAKRHYPDIAFSVGDAWKTLTLLKLRKALKSEDELGYDVVYADIGGLSGSDGHLESLSLLDSLGYALEPRCIVIKSLCMRHLAGRLKAIPDIWEKYNSC
jgi:protein-L-isoaspartate O-methyltransferase